jgi:hypothetical protein
MAESSPLWLLDVNDFLQQQLASHRFPRRVVDTCFTPELNFNLAITAPNVLPYASLSEALTRLAYYMRDGIDGDARAFEALHGLVAKHQALLLQETPRCASCYKKRGKHYASSHPGVFGCQSDCRRCSRLFREDRQAFWGAYDFVAKPYVTDP